MNAQEIVKALGGRWSGSAGVARCPAHNDHEPSLSVRDGDGGRLLTHCHAGCSAEAVWAALVNRGLAAVPGQAQRIYPTKPHPMGRTSATSRGSINLGGPPTSQRSALDIWHKTRPAQGSPVEDYLRSRGITRPIPHTTVPYPYRINRIVAFMMASRG